MSGLVSTARALARASPRRPRQADLKRAVSTAYYAAFHALAEDFADLVCGGDRIAADWAWERVYRSLSHTQLRGLEERTRAEGLPAPVVELAASLRALHKAREEADYSPGQRYGREQVLELIDRAEQVIAAYTSLARPVRRQLMVLALFTVRR